MAAPSDITQNTSTLVETESLDTLGRWDWSDFTGSNWDKYWPYQLSILQVDDNGGKPSYSTYRGLTFTLPYSPESMQVVMPFAISVQATQDGIVEQHGGVPFRSIVFSGSFGVYINRPMAEANPGAIAGIAGGQLNGLGSANAAQQTVNAVKGLVGLSTPSNLIRTEDVSPMLTGYWQCLQLRKFLEAYAEVKKTKLGPKLRLALVQWKDQSAWLVTPQRFEVIRQAPAPFEYKYMLQFQAWRRINPNNIKSLGRGGAPSYVSNDKRKSSALQVALTKLDQSRKVLDKASATMGAIRADVEKVMGVAPVGPKFLAFNWHVLEVDGHDLRAISRALDEAGKFSGGPTLIVARTVKGKGVPFFEHKASYHGVPPSDDELNRALEHLGHS